MTNVRYEIVEEHSADLIAFFYDLLLDKTLPPSVSLGEVQEWCDNCEEFEIAVILSLGFDELGWDTPADSVVTREMMKAALLGLGYDFDFERAKARLLDHVKTYQGAVDTCGEESRFRIAKQGYIRLRDESQSKLDRLVACHLSRKGA